MIELQKQDIFEINTSHNYEINPYINCSHHCIYCFVKYKKDNEHTRNKITAKEHLPESLANYLADLSVDELPEKIFFCSQTDPYQHLEAELKIIRRCLEIISQYPIKVEILTKSALILRDIDLLSKMDCQVYMSFCLTEESLREKIEPGASPIEDRIQALKTLHDNKIKTAVKLKPILPFFLSDPKAIIEKVKNYVSDKIYIQGMLYGEGADKVATIAKKYAPEQYVKWQDIEYREKMHDQTIRYLSEHPLVELLPIRYKCENEEAKKKYQEYGFY